MNSTQKLSASFYWSEKTNMLMLKITATEAATVSVCIRNSSSEIKVLSIWNVEPGDNDHMVKRFMKAEPGVYEVKIITLGTQEKNSELLLLETITKSE